MVSAPGPQVGRLAIVPIILPPVACRADRAAFKAGSNAGSGFLMWEKIDGMRFRREVMTSLVRIGCERAFTSLIGSGGCILGFVRVDEQALTQRDKGLFQVSHDHHLCLVELGLRASR